MDPAMREEEQSDYDSHMNDLLMKISTLFDGVDAIDVAQVTALCCAWACHASSQFSDKRSNTLSVMIKFMREEFRKMEVGGQDSSSFSCH
jgi:hypothetical protein